MILRNFCIDVIWINLSINTDKQVRIFFIIYCVKYRRNIQIYIITGKKYTNYHFTSKFSNYDSRHNENTLKSHYFFLFKWNIYRIENRIYLTNKFEIYVLRLNVRKYKKWITLYSEVLFTNAFHRGSTLIIVRDWKVNNRKRCNQ